MVYKDTILQSGEGMQQEHGVLVTLPMTARRGEGVLILFFIYSGTLFHGKVLLKFSTFELHSSGIIFTNTPEVCLLGDSKPSQVDNKYQLSHMIRCFGIRWWRLAQY